MIVRERQTCTEVQTNLVHQSHVGVVQHDECVRVVVEAGEAVLVLYPALYPLLSHDDQSKALSVLALLGRRPQARRKVRVRISNMNGVQIKRKRERGSLAWEQCHRDNLGHLSVGCASWSSTV